MRFSVVILNYQTVEDTKKCINSIRKYQNFKQGSIDVVVVDNGSPNGCGDFLKREYSKKIIFT